jgi:hypothetical protein
MQTFFILAILVLVFVIILQISKASEYVSQIKGYEKARKQSNRINGSRVVFWESPPPITENWLIGCCMLPSPLPQLFLFVRR